MALQYRAVWNDDRRDLLECGRGALASWIDGLGLGLRVPGDGVQQIEGAEVSVATADDSEADVRALRIRFSQERTVRGGHERRSTTVHWMTQAGSGWVWCDIECVSDDAFELMPDTAAPEVIPLLLAGRDPDALPRLGPKPTRVPAAGVDELVSWLHSPQRSVPVVVFSVDRSVGPAGYSSRVQESALRLAGCADVRMLTADSEDGLIAALHSDGLAAYDGAARVYLPGMDPAQPEPWRHQVVPADLLTERPATAAARISRLVLPRALAQRPPELYRTTVKQLLDRSRAGDAATWERLADELDVTVARLKAEVEVLREERDLAVMEAAESDRDAADALERLDALRTRLRALGEPPEAFETATIHEAVAGSCAEAIDMAAHLVHIVIHSEAPRDVDRMDQSPAAELWAQRILKHLRALDAYAEAKGPGFQTWCETSGHPRAISSKFISMTESQPVCQSPRLREYRVLPVDTGVDPSGHVEMFAHLKPVQGGGMQIPRIYFHDDTKGVTGKIHVGFIGPHDLMPNLQTN